MISRTPLKESLNQNAQPQISGERRIEEVKRNNNAGRRRSRRKGKGILVEKMQDINDSQTSTPCSASSSERSLVFPHRPGYGQLGTKCMVKANHFIAELSERSLSQYSVRRYFLAPKLIGNALAMA